MIDHVSLAVGDLARAARFYDAMFFALGVRRMFAGESVIAYGIDHPTFRIALANGRAEGSAAGSGHVALAARGRAAVDAAYEAALAAGGRDAGAPQARPEYGLRCYAAYLRDPDGARIELVSGGA